MDRSTFSRRGTDLAFADTPRRSAASGGGCTRSILRTSNRPSLHADIWEETGAESHVAVRPVGVGWHGHKPRALIALIANLRVKGPP